MLVRKVFLGNKDIDLQNFKIKYSESNKLSCLFLKYGSKIVKYENCENLINVKNCITESFCNQVNILAHYSNSIQVII